MAECPRCNGIGVYVHQANHIAVSRVCECMHPCPTCDGSGYIYDTDEFGYRNAIECSCLRYGQRAKLYNEASIPGRYHDAEFTKIKTDSGSVDMANARRMAWRFVREYQPGAPGILLYGTVGTGKTYLSCAILRYLILSRGIRARFIEFMHLLSDLRATFGDRGHADVVMQPLVDVPLLVIDELGKGRGSDWELSVLDELITKRYNSKKTTLFTTNYGIEVLPKAEGSESDNLIDRVGVRIHSRLMEMCEPIRLIGKDLRRDIRS
ncbi:MAG: ATP-binding protein [Myxococcota bacterium]|nr:ATP-binding protein [Myxococcota bacterium]